MEKQRERRGRASVSRKGKRLAWEVAVGPRMVIPCRVSGRLVREESRPVVRSTQILFDEVGG